MPEFSIIVPIYNAEKTLKRCLDSINTQTFRDFEIILIDDGSTDQSFCICKEYEMKGKRYIVVRQSNQGPSMARNVGLDLAIGKRICFVDSDDYIEESYLQDIFDASYENDANVVFIAYQKLYENGKRKNFIPKEMADIEFEVLSELSEKDMFGYTWVKVFRRDVIKNIRFDTTLNLFEDEVFSCQVISNCSSVGVVKNPIYNYNVGNGNSLVGRTHDDYCLKCDKVYNAWKAMLSETPYMDNYMIKKANEFVLRCYYYAFERHVDIEKYFLQLKETTFFKEHTEKIKFDNAVKGGKYKKLYFEKMKYQIKLSISGFLRKNNLSIKKRSSKNYNIF